MERDEWEMLLFEERRAEMLVLVIFFALLGLSFVLVKLFLASPRQLITDTVGLASVAASWIAFVLYVRAVRQWEQEEEEKEAVTGTLPS